MNVPDERGLKLHERPRILRLEVGEMNVPDERGLKQEIVELGVADGALGEMNVPDERGLKPLAPLPKVSRERERGTAVVDVGDVRPGRPVSVRAMTDDLDLVVHPLEGPVADPQLRPDQHAVEMSPEHPRQLLERLQTAVARQSHCSRCAPAYAVYR